MKLYATLFLSLILISPLYSQTATIREVKSTMITYPFSEPNPIPKMGNIYPYFRFDGYSAKGESKDWNLVELENEYIKVWVAPEIGGKVWGAIEKSTGKEFLYYNKVVKFRDIAMRGPWTSGGLEYNFGDIGHIPTGATPVDYVIRENEDGSVSCIVGALDLPSRTKWNVEIRLPANKAFFETRITWENATPLPVTYYHWMNAAAKARGNLQFIYPGSARIGHGGEIGDFPIDNNRDISYYENNNFGPYKSYHVLNAYSNFFGGYWHDDDFGFGHLSDYDDKPGKKIWIWGLSDQGMIWEDLLTDSDGQYVEYQSGKLFNQAAQGSTTTPFKHREFSPFDSDHMVDRWFPLKETGGMVAASEFGVLNSVRNGNELNIKLSALQNLNETLTIMADGKEAFRFDLNMKPLELFSSKVTLPNDADYTMELGNRLLYYSSDPEDQIVDRPLKSNSDINWGSAYGLYTKGLEAEKQRNYNQAHEFYQQSLTKEPAFLPSLNRMALSQFRRLEYNEAFSTISRALAIDTYNPMANYIFGLVNEKLGKTANAKSGYSISTQNVGYKVPGYISLARMSLKENDLRKAKTYAQKALQFNQKSISALEILAIVNRILNKTDELEAIISQLQSLDPTNAVASSEMHTLKKGNFLSALITNELKHESYLELAITYLNYGDEETAEFVLSEAPQTPVVQLWKAHLSENSNQLKQALDVSAQLVFPHRTETLTMLEALMKTSDHWKLRYYAGLIYWYKGRIDKASELFLACGDQPDFAPFYSAKAVLFNDDQSIRKAQELAPKNWRMNLALAQTEYEKGNFQKSLDLTKPFLNGPTGVGMSHAKSLLALQEYKKTVSFLEKFEVLPFEGANESRMIYHESCVMASLEAFQSRKFKTALNYAEKALLWPRNLGAGKPYDVDERLSNFLIAKANKALRKEKMEKTANTRIVDHQPNQYMPESANLVFQVLTLREMDKNSEALALLKNRLSESPNSKDFEWVMQVVEGREREPVQNSDSRVLRLAKKVIEVLHN